MLFRKYCFGLLKIALLIGLGFSTYSCKSLTSSDSEQCIQAGRYTYTLYMSLEQDPKTFPEGTDLRTFSGVTWVEWRRDYFYFSGGETDAWTVEGDCVERDRAFVEIWLQNACANRNVSIATSQMWMLSDDQTLVVIDAYHMPWTCSSSQEPDYLVLEWWDLYPYYEPHEATLPPERCNGERVGGYCWYLGVLNQSCDEVCAGHGGYHDATRFFAGSGGSNSRCTEVLNALGAPGETWGIGEDTLFATRCSYVDYSYGASQPSGMRVRYARATTASAKNELVQRACACQQ